MLATLVVRVLQIIFAVIVLGLSVHAAQWQDTGSIPATTSFNVFAGAFGVLVAVIGIAAIWVSAIPKLIMSGIDGLASILLLAGGIAYAAQITGVDCGSDEKVYHSSWESDLLNGGCVKLKDNEWCGADGFKQLSDRCKVIEADAAFLFLAFVASVGAAVVCFLAHKRGSTV